MKSSALPSGAVLCDWFGAVSCDCAAMALPSVVVGFPILSIGGLLFVTGFYMVVRVRRVDRVPAHCRYDCLVSKRSQRNRCFALDAVLDVRENRVLRRGVPGAKRVFRRLDWHAETSPGVQTCFVQLDGLGSASWREAGFSHTIFQLCDPFGKNESACVVVAPWDFMERMEYYE